MPGKAINRRKIPTQTTNFKTKKTSLETKKQNNKLITENENKKNFIYIILLITITFIVFSPTFKNTFTNWDDGKYTVENPLIKPLNIHTIKEMFFSKALYKRYWMGNYHPLTMLTLNINYALAKKDKDGIPSATGFQLVNIILHILNTLLVFLIILKLLKNNEIAFIAALFFGIHTLHVESVTWIAERKDVLYTFFYLWAFLNYISYVQTLKIKHYAISFILFILSLLSKGQATSFAVAIILVDYFYDRKIFSKKVILEKIPFLILALIFGLIAISAQKHGNAMQVINQTPIINRIGIASWGFTMYILKLFFPIHLSAVYPYPDIINQTIPFYFWLGLITVALVVWIAIKSFRKNKIIFFSIGFFVVNIFLLLQLLPVGSAIYADRYVYIPSIGFFIILAYLIFKYFHKNKKIFYTTSILLSIFWIILTINRIGIWRNSQTLWEDVVKKEPKSTVAWNNLGSEYNRIADKYKDQSYKENVFRQKAIKCFNNAINYKPDYSSAFYNRAYTKFLLAEKKQDTSLAYSALKDLNNSISTNLDFTRAYQQRAAVYDWLGQYQKALSDYDYAIKLAPTNADLYVNRGITKGKTGKLNDAIADFDKAISLNPKLAGAYSNRGLAYAFMKNYNEALKNYNKAIKLNPEGNTFYNRAMIFFNQKQFKLALKDFNMAIEKDFKLADVFFYKALCEKELGLKSLACNDMKIAAQKKLKKAIILENKFCK